MQTQVTGECQHKLIGCDPCVITDMTPTEFRDLIYAGEFSPYSLASKHAKA
jgi:hypothetical protein